MLKEKQIKVIKQAERKHSQEVGLEKIGTSDQKDLEELKRDAVTIVKEWVNELRRKKAQEATHGFQDLFSKAA
jgi:hypothetical protein